MWGLLSQLQCAVEKPISLSLHVIRASAHLEVGRDLVDRILQVTAKKKGNKTVLASID